MSKFHNVHIAGIARMLPVVQVSERLGIAFLKLYGDVVLLEACATELAAVVQPDVGLILGPESGGILLAHLLAVRTGKPYVVARKKLRPNMVHPLCVPVRTIGSSEQQQLFLDDADIQKIEGVKVAIVDEVISTGATISALTQLVEKAGGKVHQVLAVATEGAENPKVDKLCHLPLFELPEFVDRG